MENKYLIDLSVKFGLSGPEVSKVVDMVYQTGVHDIDSRAFKRIADYICEAGIVEKPAEEVLEELRLKGLVPKMRPKA